MIFSEILKVVYLNETSKAKNQFSKPDRIQFGVFSKGL